jgi:hypothetical protein
MTDNKRNKPMCVLCHVPLYKSENEDYQWICTKEKSHKYQIYHEIMAYESDFSSIYNEEENNLELEGLEGVGGPQLLVADDDFDEDIEEDDSIPIPDYMKPGPGKTLVEYREE